MDKLKLKIKKLEDIILNAGKAIVAFSGGIDSSLLLLYCKRLLAEKVLAVTFSSPLQKNSEIGRALEIAKRLNVRQVLIEKDILDIPDVLKNTRERCYYCKKYIFSEIIGLKNNYPGYVVLDGSNLSDLSSNRPGLEALKDLGVISPFALAGINKKDILAMTKNTDLSNYDIKGESCLATRFTYGQPLDKEKLKMIDDIEERLGRLGLDEIRLRIHGNLARLEISSDVIGRLNNTDIKKIVDIVKKGGYTYVTLDLEGFRSGSMDL